MGTEPIRVMHVGKVLGSGGTEKAIEVFAENINEENFDVSVVGIHEGGIRGEYLRSQGHDVTVLGSPKKLGETIRKKNPQIVHLHGSGLTESTTEELKSADVPNIVLTDNFGWPNKSKVDSIVDRYYFISDMTRLRFFRLFSVDREHETLAKYQRMYYPLSRSELETDESPAFREKLNICSNVPVIGKISRQEANNKWSQIEIDAFERVVRVKPETIILLVNPLEDVKREIKRRGLDDNCHYIDYIHPREVYKFYDSIDVMAHSSKIGESFGYVIAESLARETPVVVNSTPMRDNAQIELVDHGETGFVANSSQSFASAIIELIEDDDKRRKFGKTGKKRALQRFGPKKVTQELEKEYFRLANHSGEPLSDSTLQLGEFESEYRSRLHTSFGQSSMTYQLEHIAWQAVSNFLPLWRYPVYHLLRYNKLPDDTR
ncbi:glycosyltransferase family 4 protein [Halorubrum sp. DM2]|uniref:glycosyltransferase family 4 protein n=1 Tax=Halorubrum sp. DM2 TaxID=2527867 RepID=UPI0024B69D16|nr:glycosyltransferase family 4 protein [Halorubrum sp. DM2]